MGTGRPPRILLIIIKNTSTLDYALPLLWKTKEAHPAADVSVLHCSLCRKEILRDSQFHSRTLSASGVLQRDFTDLSRRSCEPLGRFWRRVFCWTRHGWSWVPGFERTLARCKSLLAYALLDVQQVLPVLDPDVILFDNRTLSQFHRRDLFYDFCERTRRRVVLLPHAPHHTGTTAFTPFNERGEALPDYCEFWMPFKFDRSWEKLPERKDQFVYVGYPGLDSEWLAWVQAGAGAGHARPDGPLRCLFIIRKFFDKGERRPPGHDAYAFDYEEFTRYVRLVAEALRRSDREVELVVKPHPSNELRPLERVLRESGIPRWSIARDSIYAEVPRCDLVVSLYSTTLLIPAMAGIPVVLLHSRIQDEIHRWDEMKQLYTGLRFYLENPEDLPERLGEVVDLARERRRAPDAFVGPDVEHLRSFYPDGAAQRCLERLGCWNT